MKCAAAFSCDIMHCYHSMCSTRAPLNWLQLRLAAAICTNWCWCPTVLGCQPSHLQISQARQERFIVKRIRVIKIVRCNSKQRYNNIRQVGVICHLKVFLSKWGSSKAIWGRVHA